MPVFTVDLLLQSGCFSLTHMFSLNDDGHSVARPKR